MRLRTWTVSLTLATTALLTLSGCTNEAGRLYDHAKQAANNEGDHELALELIDQAIELDPDRGRYHRRRGEWLREMGRVDEALAAFDRAAEVAEPDERGLIKAIDLCIEVGRLDEAARRIERASEILTEADRVEELDEQRQRLEVLRAAASAEPPAPQAETPSEPAAAAGPQQGVAWVEWNLTNEQNIAEFHVLRGETRDGPWTTIATIEGQGPGIHGPQAYSVPDRGLEVGRVLFYMIEHVNTEGVALRAGPVAYTVQPEEIREETTPEEASETETPTPE